MVEIFLQTFLPGRHHLLIGSIDTLVPIRSSDRTRHEDYEQPLSRIKNSKRLSKGGRALLVRQVWLDMVCDKGSPVFPIDLLETGLKQALLRPRVIVFKLDRVASECPAPGRG